MFRPGLLDLRDNRLKGLMQEVLEAIADCDDPDTLRRMGVNLRFLSSSARGKGYDLQPPQGNRTW